MRAVSNFLVRGYRTYIQCTSSVEMAQGKSEEPLLPHRTQTVFNSTTPLLSPPARSVPFFRRDRFEWDREPRGASWHIPAAALLALGGVAAATSDRVAEAQESPQELSWDDLIEIADLLSIQDRSDVEELKKECFNRAITLCVNRNLSFLPLKKLLLLKGPNGQPFLITAVHEGAPSEIIRELLKEERKQGLYSYDSMGNTPLHYAALHDRYDLIDDMWRYTHHKNHKGQTPLHVAIEGDLGDFVKRLILKGANRREQWQGLSPLALAVQSGAQKSFKALAPQLFELKQTVPGGGRLLHLAILNGQQEMLEFLLERRTYFKTTQELLLEQDSEGRTPFTLACALGDAEAATFLHQKGGEKTLNHPDPQGESAAHWAAKNYQWPIIERLGSWRANLEAKDQEGKRPIDMISGDSPEAQETRTAIEMAINRQIIGEQSTGFSIKLPVNLVLKGGGPKGIAYIGALKALRERHLDREIKNVAGTSAGAITAAMIAFCYSPEEMEEELTQKNLTDLLDPKDKSSKAITNSTLEAKKSENKTWSLLKLLSEVAPHPERTYRELSATTGLCKGEDARLWFEQLIFKQIRKVIRKEDASDEELRHLTFKQLREFIRQGYPFKHLTICATSLTDQESITFSSREPSEYDDLIISDAIRASMSIPGVFEPHILHYKNTRGERLAWNDNRRFVDGGLLRNFPITAYDDPFNRETLGLSLTAVGEGLQTPPQKPTNPLELAKAVAMIYFNAEEILLQQDTRNRNRVVEIPIKGVGLLDFDLTKEKQKELIQAGCDAVNSSPLFPEKVDRSPSRRVSVEAPLPYFSGRAAERALLKNQLLDRTLPWDKRVIVHLISGFPGMGKTELARKVVDESLVILGRTSYAFEIDWSNEESINMGYRLIAEKLRVYLSDNPSNETIHRRVFEKLAQQKDPWVIIANNVDRNVKKELVPRRGGHLLITSILTEVWSNPDTFIPLNPLELDEATQLISTITGEPPSLQMRSLAIRLDCFPLAIQQASYFIRGVHAPGEPNNFTISEYLQEFSPLAERKEEGVIPDKQRYAKTLDAVWKLTFQQLADRHPKAWADLKLFSWFSSEQIPINCDYKNHEKLKESINTLKTYGIIREYKKNKFFSIHPLIQEAIQKKQLSSHDSSGFINSVETARNCFKIIDERDLKRYDEEFIFGSLSHLGSIIDHANSFQLDHSSKIYELFFYRGQIYHYALGHYFTAISEYKKSLEHATIPEDEKPKYFARLNENIGACYFKLGLFKDALPFLEEASRLDIKFDISTTGRLISFTRCLIRLEEFEKAEKEILKMQSMLESKNHINCNDCSPYFLEVKADYFEAMGNYSSAIRLYNESIERNGNTDKDPYILKIKLKLAACHFKNKEHHLAIVVFKAVLENQRSMYIKGHPIIVKTLHDYGNALISLKYYKEALPILLELLETRIKSADREAIEKDIDQITNCLKTLPIRDRQETLQKIIPLCEEFYGKEDPRIAQLQELGKEKGLFGIIRSWFSP